MDSIDKFLIRRMNFSTDINGMLILMKFNQSLRCATSIYVIVFFSSNSWIIKTCKVRCPNLRVNSCVYITSEKRKGYAVSLIKCGSVSGFKYSDYLRKKRDNSYLGRVEE